MDYNRVLDTAKLFAKEQNVQILPEIHYGEKTIRNLLGLTGKSNPDLKVGADLIDVKSPFSTSNIVRNANDAAKQGAYACITDHLAFIDETKIKYYAQKILQDPHYTKDTVYFVVNNKLHKITTADISVG